MRTVRFGLEEEEEKMGRTETNMDRPEALPGKEPASRLPGQEPASRLPGQEPAPGLPGKETGSGRSEQGTANRLTETMRLQIESRSRNEEFARVVVAAFASRLDPTLMEIDDLKTAVSEAVTNAVIHGYGGGEGIIYIEASVCGRELTVTVRDTGVGIPDIPKAMEPMFTTDRTGERSGMGFAFMEAFMDQVEVRSEVGRGTAVTMKKQMGG